jgi:hypothetical protein
MSNRITTQYLWVTADRVAQLADKTVKLLAV